MKQNTAVLEDAPGQKQGVQVAVEPIRYVLYARKSTEAEDRQILSIASQEAELMKVAERDGLRVTKIFRESKTAKAPGRPVFEEMLQYIETANGCGLLVWKLDRLARNALDGGKISWLMDRGLVTEIRTPEKIFRNIGDDKFMMSLDFGIAKKYVDDLSVNVKRGLRARCEMGLRPGVAPTGYLNEKNVDKKCHTRLDPKRSVIIKQMYEKIAFEKWSGRQVFRWLKKIGFKTKTGKPLVLGNIYLILRNHFYYGEFEYPVGSGKWYIGKHTPIITKELFNKTQEVIDNRYIPKTESKEFAFTKLIKCGYCGSGISADEKFKKLVNGGANRHVYYFCTQARNIDCKNPAINEPDLIEELIGMIGKINLDTLGVKAKIDEELARYNKFRAGVLGMAKKERNTDIDVRNYAKYLLKEGTIIEKRELLSCLQSKLELKDKKIYLQE